MPRYPARPLPDGWQVARRSEGYYLQRRDDQGKWVDVAGPFKQYGSAYKRWVRTTKNQA